MKSKLLLLFAFLSIYTYSQAPTVNYVKYKKYTTAQKNSINISDTSKTYLVFDSDLNEYQYNSGLGWFSLSSSITASNGLNVNETTGDIELGGELTSNTTIDMNSKNLVLNDGRNLVFNGTNFGSNVTNNFGASAQNDISFSAVNGDYTLSSSNIRLNTNVNNGHILLGVGDDAGLYLHYAHPITGVIGNYLLTDNGNNAFQYIDDNVVVNNDNSIPNKKYVDDIVSNIDLTGYVEKSGDNITGNIVIDSEGTTDGVAGSILAVKKNHTEPGLAVSTFLETEVNTTADISADDGNAFHGIVSRNTYLSDFNNPNGGIYGSNLVGRHSGAGELSYVYGIGATAENNGSGYTDFLIPITASARITGTGTSTVNYARGNSITINNPNANVNYAQCHHPALMLEEGTLNLGGHVMFLDIDVDTDNLGNSLNVNGEVSYLQGGGGTDVQALKTHLSDKGQKLRFIYNQGNVESDFNGIINVLNDVSEIDSASEKVLVTKEWVQANPSSDNLGNHLATESLDVAENDIINVDRIIPSGSFTELVGNARVTAQLNTGSVISSGHITTSSGLTITGNTGILLTGSTGNTGNTGGAGFQIAKSSDDLIVKLPSSSTATGGAISFSKVTTPRTWNLPDKDGDVALVEDIIYTDEFYEEGTYTPVFLNHTASSTAASSFIRVGNLVTVNINITSIDGTGQFRLSKPFPSVSLNSTTPLGPHTDTGVIYSVVNSDLTDDEKLDYTLCSGTFINEFFLIKRTDISTHSDDITFNTGRFEATITYMTDVYQKP